MTVRGWWMLALTGAGILCAVVLGLSLGITPRFWAGVALLALVIAFWAVVSRPDQEDTPRSLTVMVVLIVAAGGLTAVDTSLAFFQSVVFPAAWTLTGSLRRSVLACAAIALSETAGFLIRLGISPFSVTLALTIEGISLIFAVAMGVWITRIAHLGDERKRLLDELTAAQSQLEVLHRDAGATSERERLARELHDTIAQSLTGQVLLAQRARRELARGALSDETLELLEDGAREALAETRSLVAAGARVELPGGGGLAEALTQLAARFQRESGIEVAVQSSLSSPLDRDAEVVLLRCAQEGLANVRKHSGASHVRLELGMDGDGATVRVVDDGAGFDPTTAASAGFGLSGLRDRLGLVGGSLAVDGTPGATVLSARLPIASIAGPTGVVS